MRHLLLIKHNKYNLKFPALADLIASFE